MTSLMRTYRIGLVGSGNVAWHLAQNLEDVGHSIVAVYSATEAHAQTLADNLYDAKVLNEPDFRETNVDVLLIAVSDDAIEQVCKLLVLPPDVVIAHTSGTRPLGVLNALPNPKGVFYPLQTFSKNKHVDIGQVPFCLEFDGDVSEQILYDLASSVSRNLYNLDSQQRRVLHISAVFACNFTNHLWRLSQEILSEQSIDFEILKPLIQETVAKSMAVGPEKAQTGPAARRDLLTIEQHLLYLQGNPPLHDLYKLLTESILRH
ncbi:Predicted oxidoreductase, contains short-chain dehydrogenase (SDR) and DUF2520 domains [Flexibacter flexilis DSM 6793]|uniref:Predicted oxidoreductase, contains short-chain dehydrogenase (SDR) and DUF2520 domains n=2 Tax=Flexibacter flexilis TaxID=998 RepID=A0A1I1FA92_9BACT|nr:Predicted oxidoreductase, contains short-chain dehydrogenase (SDR) and DUF2520 domains [Flexibacter flexilis DSM 6793]